MRSRGVRPQPAVAEVDGEVHAGGQGFSGSAARQVMVPWTVTTW